MTSRSIKKTNVADWPVMPKRCGSCPFGDKGQPDRDVRLANMVRERSLTMASQICHHPRIAGKKEDHLCRGARNYQLQVFYQLGILPAPTDEAWVSIWEELKASKLKASNGQKI